MFLFQIKISTNYLHHNYLTHINIQLDIRCRLVLERTCTVTVVFLFATTNCCEKWHRGLRVTVNVLLVDSLLHQGRPVRRVDAIRVHLTARHVSHSAGTARHGMTARCLTSCWLPSGIRRSHLDCRFAPRGRFTGE